MIEQFLLRVKEKGCGKCVATKNSAPVRIWRGPKGILLGQTAAFLTIIASGAAQNKQEQRPFALAGGTAGSLRIFQQLG